MRIANPDDERKSGGNPRFEGGERPPERSLERSPMQKTGAMLQEAYRLQRAGAYGQAEALYRSVLVNEPDNFHALNLMGVISLRKPLPLEAVEFLERAVEIDPGEPQTQANLGLARKEAGLLEAALVAFRRAVELAPMQAKYQNNVGNILVALGRPAGSLHHFQEALKTAPQDPDILTNLSRAFLQLNRPADAQIAAQRALEELPTHAGARARLGDALIRQCRYAEAAQHFLAAASADQQDDELHVQLASALKESGDVAAAERVLTKAAQTIPKSASLQHAIGLLSEQSGSLGPAAEAYHRALALNPHHTPSHFQLAQIKGRPSTRTEMDAIAALLEEDSLRGTPRAYLHFAMGHAFEKHNRISDAFQQFEHGHAAILSGTAYDAKRMATFCEETRSVFDDSRIYPAYETSSTVTPVLVVGMPRSGTSLVEQILASHSEVAGAGESCFLQDAVERAERLGGERYPHCLFHLTPNDLRELGEEYLTKLAGLGMGRRVVVDKTPLNFQYMGFVRLIAPSVRIIHCVRSPVETCLSIFRLPFDKQQTWAHTLPSLGDYHTRYRELVRFWCGALPEPIIEVRYEAVVDDVEAQSRALLSALGLNFEPNVLRFFETKRLVRTPSASQVHQPIFRDSLNLSARYGSLLADLQTVLNQGGA